MKTLTFIYKVNNIEKRYDREIVSVFVNNVQMISFGEEGNLSKNEENADQFIKLLNDAWSLCWFE